MPTKTVSAVITIIFIAISNLTASEHVRNALVWPELLEAAKLKIVWENQLPIKEGEKQDRLYVAGNYFYSFTDNNYIISLNKKDGNFIFGQTYALPGFPILGFDLFGDELISIIGNNLLEISAASGLKVSQTPLQFGVSCPATRNKTHFYIAGVDRRVHVFSADKKVEMFRGSADDNSIINSIHATDDKVIFSTETGKIIAMKYDKPVQLWQFQARSGIADALVLDEGAVFAASRDTNIYALDAQTGNLLWNYQTQAILGKRPKVTSTTLYQYVWGKGLTALSRTDGQLQWKVPGGLELLSEKGGKSYVITEDQKLVVMDNIQCKELYTVNFSDVTRYVSNTEDSRIYIGDDSGRVACLEPVEE